MFEEPGPIVGPVRVVVGHDQVHPNIAAALHSDTVTNTPPIAWIARCPRCRIAVWSNYGGGGDAVRFVRVGTLDEPDRLPPDIHIFTHSKQPWVTLPADKPAVPEYYKSSEIWPAESLGRRARLFPAKPAQ